MLLGLNIGIYDVQGNVEKESSAAEIPCMKILLTFIEIFPSLCVLVVFFEIFTSFGSKNTHQFSDHLSYSFEETAQCQQLLWYLVSQILSTECCIVKCTGYFSTDNLRNDQPGAEPQS